MGDAQAFIEAVVDRSSVKFKVVLDRKTPTGTYPIKVVAIDSSGA
jgi:hypothetical protein